MKFLPRKRTHFISVILIYIVLFVFFVHYMYSGKRVYNATRVFQKVASNVHQRITFSNEDEEISIDKFKPPPIVKLDPLSEPVSETQKPRSSPNIFVISEFYDKLNESLNTTYARSAFYAKTDIDDILTGGVDLTASTADHIDVVVCMHSHNDPGWGSTLKQYYEQSTHSILNSLVASLTRYEDLRFVWSETVYLAMWWKDSDDDTRDRFKALLLSGRLEIAGGGWVVPDEAVTHYFSLISQYIDGHRWLEHNLDYRPANVWSLDVFGYSASQSLLHQAMGYQNSLMIRISSELKREFIELGIQNVRWHHNRNSESALNVSIMYYPLYNTDQSCGLVKSVCTKFDYRFTDVTKYSEAKTIQQAELLIHMYKQQAAVIKDSSNTIMSLVGYDFGFGEEKEFKWFNINYGKMFSYINDNLDKYNITIRWGTPNDYFNLLKKKIKTERMSLYGDFMPYRDVSKDYWSGYYTSIPSLKSEARHLSSLLRTADLLNVLASLRAQTLQHSTFHALRVNTPAITEARQALSLFQHHDAITGTHTEEVRVDYITHLTRCKQLLVKVISNCQRFLLTYQDTIDKVVINWKPAVLMNLLDRRDLYLSSEPVDFQRGLINFSVFNSATRSRVTKVEMIIKCQNIEIKNESNKSMIFDLFSLSTSQEEYKLVFYTPPLSALSISTYRITCDANIRKKKSVEVITKVDNKILLSPGNKYMNISMVADDIDSLYINGVFVKFGFAVYENTKSGLYTFHPHSTAVPLDGAHNVSIHRGSTSYEVTWTYAYSDTQFIHINLKIPVHCNHLSACSNLRLDVIMKAELKEKHELVLTLNSDLSSGTSFFTDSNGLQMLLRKRYANLPIQACVLAHCYTVLTALQLVPVSSRNMVPEHITHQCVQANYYPMTSHMYIQDHNNRFNVFSSHSMGVSSQSDGQMEIMIDRIVNTDEKGIYGSSSNTDLLASFILFIEDIRGYDIRETDPRVTPLAHELCQEMSMPSLISVFSNEEVFKKTLGLKVMHDNFPDDIELISLHSLALSGHHKLTSAALTLRRIAFERNHRIEADEDREVNLDTFSYLRPVEIQGRTVSLMYNITEVIDFNSSERILEPLLKESDILSWILHFKTA